MQNVIFAGVGAIGSRMALESGRPDLTYLLIDDDRVDGNNVRTGSTIYWRQHIDAFKAEAVAAMLYRRFGSRADASIETLTPSRMKAFNYFHGALVVVDGFDNMEARFLTTSAQAPVLHVGVSETGTGLVAWNENYKFPPVIAPRGANPVCTHALGRGIITFTASVAALILADYLDTGQMRSVVTTRKLQVIDL